jgi:hypothetical protein
VRSKTTVLEVDSAGEDFAHDAGVADRLRRRIMDALTP